MDVDHWAVSLSPSRLMHSFTSVHSMVHLSAHAPPSIRDHPIYTKWLYLGDAGCKFLIDMKYKSGFFKELQKDRPTKEAAYPTQATYGRPVIPLIMVIKCLQAVMCPTIRVQVYGQKLPLHLVSAEPADVKHSLASTNHWDLAYNYPCKDIILFQPAHKKPSSMSLYPMIIPESRHHGSVSFSFSLDGDSFQVKVYPLLVHSIKSWHGKLNFYEPSNCRALKTRRATIEKMIGRLETAAEEWESGGFRVEVTLYAPTLVAAQAKVRELKLCQIMTWMSPPPELNNYALSATALTKKQLIQNARMMVAASDKTECWHGSDGLRPTIRQKKIVRDCFAAFGWNKGGKPVTHSLSKLAWWLPGNEKDFDIQMGGLSYANQLHKTHRGLDKMKELYQFFQKALGGVRKVPCRNNPRHNYKSVSYKSTFRLRCVSCKENIDEFATREWFGLMVQTGKLPREAAEELGMFFATSFRPSDPRLPIGEDEEETDSDLDLAPGMEDLAFAVEDEDDIPPPAVGKRKREEAITVPSLSPPQAPLPILEPIELLPGSRKPVRSISLGTPFPLARSDSILKDGNCQFRAFGIALDGGQTSHVQARRRVVEYLRLPSSKEKYKDFTIGSYEEWVESMARDSTYGDHVTLMAMTEIWGKPIAVLNEGSWGYFWNKVTPTGPFLPLFLSGEHYENLFPL